MIDGSVMDGFRHNVGVIFWCGLHYWPCTSDWSSSVHNSAHSPTRRHLVDTAADCTNWCGFQACKWQRNLCFNSWRICEALCRGLLLSIKVLYCWQTFLATSVKQLFHCFTTC